MIAYLDSSFLLRALLGDGQDADVWREVRAAGASDLLGVECHRVIDRLRLDRKLHDAEVGELKRNLRRVLSGITTFAITREVLGRAAGPFPTVVGTLDAIHLATALFWGEKLDTAVVLLTLDQQLRTAPLATGLDVSG